MDSRALPASVFSVHLVILSLVILLLIAAPAATATVLVVHPDGSGPFPDIQSAISAALSGDVIELTDGVFQGPRNGALDLEGKALTFRSQSGSAEACIVSLDDRPFIGHFSGAGADFLSLSLRHARAIYLYAAGIRFSSCIFEECSGVAGGGYCSIEFRACLFLGATGGQAGVGENGSLVLDHCAVRGSTAPPFSTNHIRAVACTFENNEADYLILVEYSFFPGSAQFETCQFLENRCTDALILVGGGADAGMHCQDCTFARNEGRTILCDQSYGYHQDLGVVLTSCTFADNSGDGSPEITMVAGQNPIDLAIEDTILSFRDGGSAVACEGSVTVSASCSDVYGNSGGDWTACLDGLEGTAGNISADPLYCRMPQSESPYVLRDDSPCLPRGPCGLIGAWGLGCSASDVAENGPAEAYLVCRPNPFGASTRLVLSRAPHLAGRLQIFDPSGRQVREIDWPAGWLSTSWDGADQQGRRLPAGIYLYRFEGRSGRVLILR